MLRKTITILFTAIWLISQSAGAFVVLCYGPDGAVSIEPVIQDKCSCPSDSSDDAGLAINTLTDKCTDIPLSLSPTIKVQHKPLTADLPAPVAAQVPILPDQANSMPATLFAPPLQPVITTVILII